MDGITCDFLAPDGRSSYECMSGITEMRFLATTGEPQATFVLMPEPQPNKVTIKALEELEEGGGREFTSLEALFEDLNN